MDIAIEAAELGEPFLWRISDEIKEMAPKEKELSAEELLGVAAYLSEMADNLGGNLTEAIPQKLEKNAAKYLAAEAPKEVHHTMKLYSGSTTGLIDDSVHNRIAGKLSDAFFAHFRYQPQPSEVNSWRNSLRAMCLVFGHAELLDHGVLLEYQLPQTSKRLDCLVSGRDGQGRDSAVIVELKQWETCQEAYGDKVVTFVGHGRRDVLHPSAQVYQYQCYLQDGHTAFHEDEEPVSLASCAYLHNYEPVHPEALFSARYKEVLELAPTFAANQVEELSGFLKSRLAKGNGELVLQRIEKSQYKASKKLLEHVSGILAEKPEYTLLDEQMVVFESVLNCVSEGFRERAKRTVIIKGGPGTGKSVIALNLMSRLAALGLNAHYATGSRAFTTTLREIVGRRASQQFKYFNGYITAERDAVDVIIGDEAHRIRVTSHSQWTPAAERTGKPQIEELLNAGKVTVFFVDDRQVVKPGEIGSSEYIRDAAQKLGSSVVEYQLEAQFRCSGSDGFINWVNNTLEIERTPNVLWNLEESFEFRIAESPEQLDGWIREKAQNGQKARLSAGFCWPWSKPKSDGTLVHDVHAGSFSRPWNARPNAGHLADGIPESNLWAYDPGGIEQVGCVYTAQGFEFDYIGVIFGTDLVYRPGQGWVGDRNASRDRDVRSSRDRFVDLVKNTYRVLLTRGMLGCYVHFQDKETENFFRSRLERFSV
ncbi:DNA/RNA helicase domain-containing protein [Bryobacter aggregatus]|uniref:DNA/RNA helicase domain-containing protein n=1 Tax=Bryobacter aggregatus TaxID=360054 RepID=UPI00138E463F|nr:DNA/RNA helicase domain-containing protein [Bryobacter aggregatus]